MLQADLCQWEFGCSYNHHWHPPTLHESRGFITKWVFIMCSWSAVMKFMSRSSYHQEAGLIVACTLMLPLLKEIVSQALCMQLCLQSLYKYDHHFIQSFAGNYSCMPSGQTGFNRSLTIIWRTISWAILPIGLEISRRLLRLSHFLCPYNTIKTHL